MFRPRFILNIVFFTSLILLFTGFLWLLYSIIGHDLIKLIYEGKAFTFFNLNVENNAVEHYYAIVDNLINESFLFVIILSIITASILILVKLIFYYQSINIQNSKFSVLLLLIIVFIGSFYSPVMNRFTGIYTDGLYSKIYQPVLALDILQTLTLPALWYFLSVMYYATSLFIGYAFLFPIIKRTKTPFLVSLFASFLPGYIIVVSINRLVTYMFPYSSAAVIVLIGMVSLVLMLYVKNVSGLKTFLQEFRFSRNRKEHIYFIGLFILLFFIILIVTLQRGKHPFCGHAVNYIIENGYILLENINHHVPIFGYHYDEFFFNYPLIYFFKSNVALIFHFWIVNTFMIVSIIFMLYSIFIYFGLSSPLASIYTAFLMIGSHTLSPVNYLLMFDSGNPLVFNVHVGRMISCVLPVFLLLRFGMYGNHGINSKWNNYELVLIVLFGLGIPSLSFHVFIYTMVFLFMIILYRISNSERKIITLNNTVILMMISFMIFVPFYTKFLTGSENDFLGIPIVITSIISSAVLFQFIRPLQLRGAWKQIKEPFLVILSAVTSAVLFGNLITLKFHGFMRLVGDELQNLLGYNPYGFLFTRIFSQDSPIRFFEKQLENMPLTDFLGMHYYVTYYGFVTLLIYGALFVFMRRNYSRTDYGSHEIKGLGVSIYLNVILFIMGIFFTSYSYLGMQRWFTTRFIEVPFYTLLILCLIILGKTKLSILQYGTFVVIALWTILPFIYNQRIEQWLVNAKAFFSVIF